MAYARTPLAERFEKGYVIARDTGCWNWIRSKRPNGYGQIGKGGHNCRILLAHRVAYELYCDPIPKGLDIDHLCRNRGCVNPDHLEPVTRRINLLRGETIAARRAAQTRCIHGHEFTPGNTMRAKSGTRECRTRKNARNRRARLAQKNRGLSHG